MPLAGEWVGGGVLLLQKPSCQNFFFQIRLFYKAENDPLDPLYYVLLLAST